MRARRARSISFRTSTVAKPGSAQTAGRFLLVGGANTLIDFAVLLGLTALGLGLWPANVVSTAVALVFSFFANRSFTFRSDAGGPRQVVLFLTVTLVGLWLLQPLVMQAFLWLCSTVFPGILQPTVALVFAKLAATAVTLVWNFVLYRTVVFTQPRVKEAP